MDSQDAMMLETLGQFFWLSFSLALMLLMDAIYHEPEPPETELVSRRTGVTKFQEDFWRLWPLLTIIKAEAQYFAWRNPWGAPYLLSMIFFGVLIILDAALLNVWKRRDVQNIMPIAGSCIVLSCILTVLYFDISAAAGYLMLMYTFTYEIPFCFVAYMYWSEHYQSRRSEAELLTDDDLEQ